MTAGSRCNQCNFNADSVLLSLVSLPSCFCTSVCGKVFIIRGIANGGSIATFLSSLHHRLPRSHATEQFNTRRKSPLR